MVFSEMPAFCLQLSFWAIRTGGLWSADLLGGPQAATLGDALGSGKSQGCLVVSGDRSEGLSSVVEAGLLVEDTKESRVSRSVGFFFVGFFLYVCGGGVGGGGWGVVGGVRLDRKSTRLNSSHDV